MPDTLQVPQGFEPDSIPDGFEPDSVPQGFDPDAPTTTTETGDSGSDWLGVGEEVRGFGRGLNRGARRFVQAGDVSGMRKPNELQAELDAANADMAKFYSEFPNTTQENNPVGWRWRQNQLGKIGTLKNDLKRAQKMQPELAESFAAQQSEIEKLPLTKAQEEFNKEETPWWYFFKNPVELSAVTLAESAPVMAETIAAAPLGPVGVASAAGMGSWNAESSGRVINAMAKDNVNLKDPKAVLGWLADRAKSQPKLAKADLAALGPAGFDALTGGLAGQVLKRTIGMGTKKVLAATAAEMGIQMAGGGAGTLAASAIAGEHVDWKDFVLEVAGEFAPGEAISNVAASRENLNTVHLAQNNSPETAVQLEAINLPELNPALIAESPAPLTVAAVAEGGEMPSGGDMPFVTKDIAPEANIAEVEAGGEMPRTEAVQFPSAEIKPKGPNEKAQEVQGQVVPSAPVTAAQPPATITPPKEVAQLSVMDLLKDPQRALKDRFGWMADYLVALTAGPKNQKFVEGKRVVKMADGYVIQSRLGRKWISDYAPSDASGLIDAARRTPLGYFTREAEARRTELASSVAHDQHITSTQEQTGTSVGASSPEIKTPTPATPTQPPAPAVAPGAAQKMPWEMTQAEILKTSGRNDYGDLALHKAAVQAALRKGKPVPEAVLADYPDLKPAPAATGATVETDPARRQEIQNSIAEGEGILKSGRNIAGRKLTKPELDAVRRSVDSSRAKLGEPPPAATGAKVENLAELQSKRDAVEAQRKAEDAKPRKQGLRSAKARDLQKQVEELDAKIATLKDAEQARIKTEVEAQDAQARLEKERIEKTPLSAEEKTELESLRFSLEYRGNLPAASGARLRELEIREKNAPPAATGAAQKLPWEMTREDHRKNHIYNSAYIYDSKAGTLMRHPAVFIRFGDIPEKGSLANAFDVDPITGKMTREVGGVSVYPAVFDKETGKYVIATGELNGGGLAGIDEISDRPAYIVSGEHTGIAGTDGEPLLKTGTVKKLKSVNLDDIVSDDTTDTTISGKEVSKEPNLDGRGVPVGSENEIHKAAVEAALREGKPVPESVLADYPDLKPIPAATPKTGSVEETLNFTADEWKHRQAKAKKIREKNPNITQSEMNRLMEEAPPAATPKAEGEPGAKIGSRVQISNYGPQTFTVVESLPQTPVEKQNGEQMLRVKNEKTGKEEIVSQADTTPVSATPSERAKPASKADLNKALKDAGLDPSAFPDAKSKKSALKRAIAKVEEAQKKLRGSRGTLQMGLPKAVLDLALETIRLSLRAGDVIAVAIQKGLAAVAAKFPDADIDAVETAVEQSIASPARAESQGLFTGQYETTSEIKQHADAEAFMAGKHGNQIIRSLQLYAGAPSAVPELSEETFAMVTAKVISNVLARIAVTPSPVENAELHRQLRAVSSLKQQAGSKSGQVTQSHASANKVVQHAAPYLTLMGLIKRRWEKALGVTETEDQPSDKIGTIVDDSATEAGEDVQDQVDEKEEENLSESSAEKIIKELAKSQSDTLSWSQPQIDGVKETVKWFVLGDISDAEFVSTMEMLKIKPNTIRVLLSVAQREAQLHAEWVRRKNEANLAKLKNRTEQQKVHAQAMIALKLGLQPIQDAESVLSRFAEAQSDTQKWTPKTMNQIRDLVSGFLNGDITESEFIASLNTVGVKGNLANSLLSVVKREFQTREHYRQLELKAIEAKKQNLMEMRKVRAAAMIAHKLGLKPYQDAQALLNRYAESQSDTQAWKEKERNQIREAFSGLLNGDITEDEFRATLATVGIGNTTIEALLGVARRELQTREYYRRVKESEAMDKKLDAGLDSEVLKAIRESGIKISTLFLDTPHATQQERREHLFKQIRARFPNLTQAQQLKLEKALSEAWENARMKVFRAQFKKYVGLPTVEAADNLLDKVQPELIRAANLGTLTEESFRNAIAKVLGLPSLDGPAATKMIKLAQEAQALPEGVVKNKKLAEMIGLLHQQNQFHPLAVMQDYWYSNALSGTRTWISVLSSLLHGATLAVQRITDLVARGKVKEAGFFYIAWWSDLIEGLANAVDVVKSGDYTRRAEFGQNITALLSGKGRMDTLEGMLKHGDKKWKRLMGLTAFSRRMIVGIDYISAISTRGSEIIYGAAISNDANQLKQAMKRFNRFEAARAKTQAKAELGANAKWVDVRARQLEILNEGVSESITDEATLMGEIVALNAPLIGFTGGIYSMVRAATLAAGNWFARNNQKRAAGIAFGLNVMFGMPFMRAALNAIAATTNYIPGYGAVNYARTFIKPGPNAGMLMSALAMLDEEGKPVSQQRRQMILSAQLTALGLTGIVFALARSYGDDDDPEERKKFDVFGGWKGMDLAEKKARRAIGQKEHTVLINGKYYSYANYPFAGALALVGYLRDIDRQKGPAKDNAEGFERLAVAFWQMPGYIKDMSMISGLANMAALASSSDREENALLLRVVQQQARNVATGIIPFASLVGEIDTWFDPQIYQSKTYTQKMLSAVPWMRQKGGFGPMYNMAGIPVESPKIWSTRIVTYQQQDPLLQALGKLVERGIVPKQPITGDWIQNGERFTETEKPELTYRHQVATLKAWREEMLPMVDEIPKMSKDEYERMFTRKGGLQDIQKRIKDDLQNELDDSVLKREGPLKPYHRRKNLELKAEKFVREK